MSTVPRGSRGEETDHGKTRAKGPPEEPEILEGLARDIVSRLTTTLFADEDGADLERPVGSGENQAADRGPGAGPEPGAPAVPGSGGAPGPGFGPRPGSASGAVTRGARAPVAPRPVWRARLTADRPALLVRGTVRSGRQIRHNGDVVVLGDLNPGGQVVAAGDVVVVGTLRGTVHAGATGDHTTVVAAFRLRPTQLRIASYLARPPEENGGNPQYPELALVSDGVIVVRPLTPGLLARLGPDDTAPERVEEPGPPLIGKQ